MSIPAQATGSPARPASGYSLGSSLSRVPWVFAVADSGGELMTAADAELGEGVSQVILDGLGAQVQLGGGLAIGQPRRHQPGHPQFLGAEPRQAGVAARPGPQ